MVNCGTQPLTELPLVAVSQTPRVFIADHFLSDAEVGQLLQASSDRDSLIGSGIACKADETGFSFEWPVEGNALLQNLRSRIADAIGIENQVGATLRFRHYLPGHGHPPHLDCFSIQGHHLIATVLLNLVTCEQGGETSFPRAWPAPLSIKARRGRMVAWFNYYPNGAPDEASYHEGRQVVAGEKITLTAFVYAPLEAARVRPAARTGWVQD